MPDRFLPDYGLYLLGKGVRPETRLVFFELPVDHLTRPDLRTVLPHPPHPGGRSGLCDLV